MAIEYNSIKLKIKLAHTLSHIPSICHVTSSLPGHSLRIGRGFLLLHFLVLNRLNLLWTVGHSTLKAPNSAVSAFDSFQPLASLA